MVIQEIEFQLKDGRKALIRSPKEDDVQGMLEYLYITAGETEFILRYPEECGVYTADGEKALFDRINWSENDVMLVCLVDGRIAGNCSLSRGIFKKTGHRASIGIALMKEFWGLGIGTRFLTELIRIAEKQKDLLQIELDYVEGNDRARALYEKMGFRITGVRPNAIRLKDGTLLNEYSMVRMTGRSSGHIDPERR